MTRTHSSETLHQHGHGDSGHDHSSREVKTSVLLVAVFLTLGFAAVEFVGGIWSQSLALIGDAGHMLTDSASLFFALVANWFARAGADRDHSYGHGRIEVMAAFINALFMLFVIGWIFWEAYHRFMEPRAVAGGTVMVIAAVGMLVNILVAWSLSRDRQNVNTRAALIHVLGDLLGSVAALVAGVVIYFGGPMVIDPILSVAIGCLVLHAVWGVLVETTTVLLDGVPDGVDYDAVGLAIAEVEGVRAVHDLHVWSMSAGHAAISAHVAIGSHRHWPRILDAIREVLRERFGIDHVTLQPEWNPEDPCSPGCSGAMSCQSCCEGLTKTTSSENKPHECTHKA